MCRAGTPMMIILAFSCLVQPEGATFTWEIRKNDRQFASRRLTDRLWIVTIMNDRLVRSPLTNDRRAVFDRPCIHCTIAGERPDAVRASFFGGAPRSALAAWELHRRKAGTFFRYGFGFPRPCCGFCEARKGLPVPFAEKDTGHTAKRVRRATGVDPGRVGNSASRERQAPFPFYRSGSGGLIAAFLRRIQAL